MGMTYQQQIAYSFWRDVGPLPLSVVATFLPIDDAAALLGHEQRERASSIGALRPRVCDTSRFDDIYRSLLIERYKETLTHD